MAEEATDGSGAAATLTADTAPWEKALDRAAERAKGWSDKVSGLFSAATRGLNSDGFERFKTGIDGLAKLGDGGAAGEKLGTDLGKKAGMALGTALGGPAGAAIGSALGSVIGGALGRSILEQIGGTELLSAIDGMAKAADEALKPLKQAWEGVGEDADLGFGRVKDIVRSLDWKELLSLPLDQAWDKIAAKAGEVWVQVEEFGAKAVFRFADALDQTWAKIREPVAAFAGWLQKLAVQFGLLEEGTESWSDAVLNVKEVGRTVVGAIGYGLGYLEGLFVKLGGIISEHLIAPLTIGLAAALKVAGEALGELAKDDKVKLAFAAVGVNIEGMAGGLDRSADRLFKAGEQLGKDAKEWQKVDPLERAEQGRKNFVDGIDKGRGLVDRDKKPPPVEPEVKEPPKEPPAFQAVAAIIAGTREAANLRARSVASDSQLKALERAAKAAEANADHGKAMLDELKDIRRVLNDSPPLRSV